MILSVRKELTEKIENQMNSHGLTWDSIQDYDIKTKWNFPRQWGVIYGVVKSNSHPPIKTEIALLEYYKIGHYYNEETNTVHLKENIEHAK